MSTEPITISTADFTDGQDEGSSLSAGNVGEVMKAEIGDDSQFSSYETVRLGQSLDEGNQRSGKGKLFVQLQDNNGNVIDSRTEVRFIGRPKNANSRRPLTSFIQMDRLNESDVTKQIPLTPVRNENGDPQLISDGRILAVEVRNPANSVTVDRSNSQITLPAIAGY